MKAKSYFHTPSLKREHISTNGPRLWGKTLRTWRSERWHLMLRMRRWVWQESQSRGPVLAWHHVAPPHNPFPPFALSQCLSLSPVTVKVIVNFPNCQTLRCQDNALHGGRVTNAYYSKYECDLKQNARPPQWFHTASISICPVTLLLDIITWHY